jgi:mono/diheme cytochrome c family protein
LNRKGLALSRDVAPAITGGAVMARFAKIAPPLLAGAILLLAGCRRDMQEQPRYDPLAGTDFFGDGRSARPQVEGTVAWGRWSNQAADPAFLRIDQARYTGKVNNEYIDYFPFPITRTDLERGQERYNIYCTPCHSRVGDGNGMIVQRGFKQAASYHTQRLINMPVGHFFDVISNGFGQMPSYASRVEPDDRWRIAAYIRVLQLSQDAPVDAVPTALRGDLDKNPATPPLPEPQPTADQVPPSAPQKIQEPIR